MESPIKFVWTFYGMDAKGMADHHVIHLKEFCQNHQMECLDSGVETVNENAISAFLTIKEKDAIVAHPLLKPHEAFKLKA